MFFKKKGDFQIPISGTMIALNKVKDEVFAQGMMGQGFAIVPYDYAIYAPVDGVIEMFYPTGHALGIKDLQGHEILIHAGIDTVELKGEGFQAYKHQGDCIKQGELLCSMDITFIKSKGLDPTVIIVFPKEKELHFPKLPCDVNKDEKIHIF